MTLCVDTVEKAHTHRTVENSKVKEPKQVFQDQTHSGIQPSTSRAGKKLPPHLMQVDASADKIAKKKRLIPKIIVTGPSEEVLINSFTDELPETRTIRESDYGSFTVHSKPSTVDAYRTSKEQ
ncbi:spermatogenesis-associated protein 33 isoform 2-T2 [Liasis olivaceus]